MSTNELRATDVDAEILCYLGSAHLKPFFIG